jgi:GntR family transcriptional repressor for pyruvate dehydrogenase complex
MATSLDNAQLTDPVSRSETIALTLRDEILRGQYRPGERLPSERDLALRFSTGRGPVREALKRLEQLGIASIQHGGARAVAIEDCTLDVLGPLLDLDELPDARLLDQVLQVFGVLVHVSARVALRTATDEQMAEIKRRATSMLNDDDHELGRHMALREFTDYLVKVADHLVLKLILNGLQTSCFARMHDIGIRISLDDESYRQIVTELCSALDDRDYAKVGDAMQRLNRFFRDSLSNAMEARRNARNSTDA